MPSNELSQRILIQRVRATSSPHSVPNLAGLLFSNLAQKLEAAATPPLDLLAGQGLAALLQAAKELPQHESWDLDGLDPENATGLTKLLIEARKHRAAQAHRGA